MVRLVRDRERLLQALRELQDRKRNGTLDQPELETLTEIGFRLALHPETPWPEAIELLRRGALMDGTHPRYAYHLARLYFLAGELQNASKWLRLAAGLCPTSHRIWTHISLLQWHLNENFKGNDRYTSNALRERGEQIAEKISAGTDSFGPELLDFQPPVSKATLENEARHGHTGSEDPSQKPISDGPRPSETMIPLPATARRLKNPGQCRWTGIHDLLFEHLLEREPSEAMLKKLAPLLEQIAASAPSRRGGVAAFVTASVQWMVCGYPLATVRRLRESLGAKEEDASLRLLDQVCALFEAPAPEVPPRLAEALTGGLVPPLLAAVIHERRVLNGHGKPRLEAIGTARRFLDRCRGLAQEEEVSRHVTRLASLVRNLRPSPPKPLRDVAGDADSRPVRQQLQALEQACTSLHKIQTQAFATLKEDLEPRSKEAQDPVAFSQAAADADAFDELKQGLAEAGLEGQRRLTDLTGLMAGLAAAERAENFELRKTTLNSQLAELANQGALAKVVKRVHVNLKRAGLTAANCPASPAILAWIRDIAGVFGAAEVEPAPQPASQDEQTGAEVAASPTDPAASFASLSGLPGLKTALEQTEDKIVQAYDQLEESFRPYGNSIHQWRPLHAMLYSLQARRAEALYRLGRRDKARATWSRMLAEDRLDTKVLKNLAVSAAGAEDVSRGLNAWQSYVEMLYLRDVVEGSPRPRARQRADFHRSLAHAYAPQIFAAKLDVEWRKKLDDRTRDELIAFFNSPGRVRNFIAHKMLEFLNVRLDFISPPLLLGVSRSDSEKTRTTAKEQTLSFLRQCKSLLPRRARDVFCKLVEQQLDEAFRLCRSAKRLTMRSDTRYQEENGRLIACLLDICELKLKFHFLSDAFVVVKDGKAKPVEAAVRRLTSPESLCLLGRLDDIPIGISMQFLQACAAQLPVKSKPEAFLGLVREQFGLTFFCATLNYAFGQGIDEADRADRQRLYHYLVRDFVRVSETNDLLPMLDDPQFAYPDEIHDALKNDGKKVSVAVIDWLQTFHDRFPELTGPARWLVSLLKSQDRYEEAIAVLDRACDSGFHPRYRMMSRCTRMWTCLEWGHAIPNRPSTDKEPNVVFEKARSDADFVIENADNAELARQGRSCRMSAAFQLGQLAFKEKDAIESRRHLASVVEDATYLIEHPQKSSAPDDELANCHFFRMMAHYLTAASEGQAGSAEFKKRMQLACEDAHLLQRISRDERYLEHAKSIIAQAASIT